MRTMQVRRDSQRSSVEGGVGLAATAAGNRCKSSRTTRFRTAHTSPKLADEGRVLLPNEATTVRECSRGTVPQARLHREANSLFKRSWQGCDCLERWQEIPD